MGSWVYKRDTFSVKNGFLKGGKGSDLGVQSPRKLNSVNTPQGAVVLLRGDFGSFRVFREETFLAFLHLKISLRVV